MNEKKENYKKEVKGKVRDGRNSKNDRITGDLREKRLLISGR